MKYIKAYKIFENNNSYIIYKLKELDIENYTINDDGTIDIENNVNLNWRQLTKMPLKFGKISGRFSCSDNQLTSLEYCPLEIGGNFHCYYNKLTMLDCSSYVKGNIYCKGNRFTEEPEFFGDCEGKIVWK